MRFPLFALITPVVTSVVLWLVTGSAYTLLFALLGPVMALAQYLDAKWQARREEARQEEREGEESLARAQQQQLEAMTQRLDAAQANPPSSRFAESDYPHRPRWAAGEVPVGVSRDVRIGINRAGGMPHLLDITKGLAIAGTDVETASVMRAITFQLAWLWGSEGEGTLTAVKSKDHIPFGVRYFLEVDRGIATLHDTIDPTSLPTVILVDLLSRAEASHITEKLAIETKNSQPVSTEIPERVAAVVNTNGEWCSARHSLVVNVGRGAEHPVLLDLVTAGPHAVVTGMTGSGKTEFLRTWLVSMAASYSPDELAILVIDFKGGAGFTQLAQLPHVVGVVTDLDHAEARRAITSLSAEIHFRERTLAQHQVSDVSELQETALLPRLVVVVDEYRAVLEAFPELLGAFVDLAARGRALGIHVILSSQRVGGSLGDALMANCAVRVGFRVSQKQDSQSLLGNDSAFLLPHIAGRGVVMGTGLEPREFQAAQLNTEDFTAVLERSQQWSEINPNWTPRSPWLPPLASSIARDEAPDEIKGMAWLGLADIPEHQVQTWAHYCPEREGNLLVTGPARSGVTNVLATLSEQFCVPCITDAEKAWDVVVEGNEWESPLLIDDLDAVLEEFDLEHREQFVNSLTRIARQAPKQGKAVVIGCSEHVRGVTALLALFPHTVTLHSAASPGRGTFQGHELQTVQSQSELQDVQQPQRMTWKSEMSYVVVSHRKRELLNVLGSAHASRVTDVASELSVTTSQGNDILLGTPDEWLARTTLLNSRKSDAVLVLDGCTTSELRGLRLRSGLFPHVGYEKTLVVEPDGSTTRVVI